MWDEILAEPRPSPALKALTGGYLFARWRRWRPKNRTAEVVTLWMSLDKVRASLPDEGWRGLEFCTGCAALAANIARSRVESRENDREGAIKTLTEAAGRRSAEL